MNEYVQAVRLDVLELTYDDRWQIFAALFDSLGVDILRHTEARGFDPKNQDISSMLMNQVSEIVEAHEAYRSNNDPESEKCPGFKHFDEEIADALLRIILDSTAKGWKTAQAAIAKDAYNQTRPPMHGGKKF